jgi:hypothetical protein
MDNSTAAHPVQLQVTAPSKLERTHVLVRILAVVVLSFVGASSLYWVLYLALPLVAAILISQNGGALFVETDVPTTAGIVGLFARAYGYLWMLTDRLPTDATQDIRFEVDPRRDKTPTVGSALLRLVTSIPAMIVLAFASFFVALMWPIAALCALATERMPDFFFALFSSVLRFQFRLVAYHLSLVDAYPRFRSASDTALVRSDVDDDEIQLRSV